MLNTGLAIGVDDLVNSANWHNWRSPVLHELRSVFDGYHQHESSTSPIKINRSNVQYEFTEDDLGTIIMISMPNQTDGKFLAQLMSKLKELGHSLDSFLMGDPYLKSQNAINVVHVKELIENKDLSGLRAVETQCSAHLAWPLVPFSVLKSTDDMFNEEHYHRCQAYHRCLRISIDRSGYPGKLKRFVDIVQQIVETNELMDAIRQQQHFNNYTSQWPST
ncbi:unnamed protein product [Rotaria sp. Silwood2]|nr:unnamed protein product [Rotaria sp. Silwood2]CAF3184377.1 unnamed protein product [Rotaria sp. Silwood2]CAF3379620.1 unnamed protein product [Rotaria sp. Silwood2]CAF3991953.1 unnamed protein product [Rotaria sp. Silwood2]CAF4251023.1 unnamed protein product [Rotaria sp. Silwood2]